MNQLGDSYMRGGRLFRAAALLARVRAFADHCAAEEWERAYRAILDVEVQVHELVLVVRRMAEGR